MPPTHKRNVLDENPRLSLVAQFDDIVRLGYQLNIGIEKEFILFVENQNVNRLKYCEIEKVNNVLKEKIIEMKDGFKSLETQKRHLRLALETADGKLHKIEEEKRSLERQISIIKEVLFSDQNAMNNQTREKLAFLDTQVHAYQTETSPRRLNTIEESAHSHTCLSSLEVSFDKTNDGLDNSGQLNLPCSNENSLSKGKRRYSENQQTDVKKPRLHTHDDSSSEKETTEGDKGDILTSRRTRSQRCFSEPVPSSDNPVSRKVYKSDNILLDDEIEFVDEPIKQVFSRTSSTPLRRLSSTGIINRAHVFCHKTIIRPETCYPCGGRIGFYKAAIKCQDCRVTCHPECRSNVPLPCYPTMHTPTSKTTMAIADFAPSTPPMIPPLMVHCIGEIEARGLTEVGIYRVSGAEREVKELKDKLLKGKTIPCLSKIDIHAICGTLKEFLRSLHEPLITKSLRAEFVKAADMHRKIDQIIIIRQTVEKLPQPNRDSLAFLIVHLNKVAESPQCKMPKDNLAKVFGPTIIGYSQADPITSSADFSIFAETKHQCKIMEILLSLPVEYWNSILGVYGDNDAERKSSLSQGRTTQHGFNGAHLRSGYASPYKQHGVVLGKTPLAPRGISGSSTKTKRFFNSPLLK